MRISDWTSDVCSSDLTTPLEFVGRARLARAHELILATGDPIASIAESVGFASRSHFSSRFRERYGEDPTAYRKRMTSGPTAEPFASVTSIRPKAEESPFQMDANNGSAPEGSEWSYRKHARSGPGTSLGGPLWRYGVVPSTPRIPPHSGQRPSPPNFH